MYQNFWKHILRSSSDQPLIINKNQGLLPTLTPALPDEKLSARQEAASSLRCRTCWSWAIDCPVSRVSPISSSLSFHSDSAIRSTSVASSLILWGEFHTPGPIFLVTGVWWLKCIEKGGSTTKREWFSELSTRFRQGNKFKSPQEGCNGNETRVKMVLGSKGCGLEGWGGVGCVSGIGSSGGW